MKTEYKMVAHTPDIWDEKVEHSIDLPEDVAMFMHLSGEKFNSIKRSSELVTQVYHTADIKEWYELILKYELDVNTIRELDLESRREVDGMLTFDEIPTDYSYYSYENIKQQIQQMEEEDRLEQERINSFTQKEWRDYQLEMISPEIWEKVPGMKEIKEKWEKQKG